MQLRLPVDETAIRDTMRAVFSQAAYTKRQPGWLARKFGELWDWIVAHWPLKQSTRESDPVLFWTVIGVLALVIIAVLARAWYLGYVRRDQGVGARPLPTAPSRSALGGDPWLMAQRFAASGDFTTAAHALYAALLEAVARRGQVKLHSSKTIGDYVRELRQRSSAFFTRFRDFSRAYEVVIYGSGQCDRERYERLHELALPIVQRNG